MDISKLIQSHSGFYASQLTLGQLKEMLSECQLDLEVFIDTERSVPGSFDSYRGYYEHLALSTNPPGSTGVTVQGLIIKLSDCLGQFFTGWKGGEFLMTESTPLWISEPGECSDQAIVGLMPWGGGIMLITTKED